MRKLMKMLKYINNRAPDTTSNNKTVNVIAPSHNPWVNMPNEQHEEDIMPKTTYAPTPTQPKKRRPRHLRIEPDKLPKIEDIDDDDDILLPRGAHAAPITTKQMDIRLPHITDHKTPKNKERKTADDKKQEKAAAEEETYRQKAQRTKQAAKAKKAKQKEKDKKATKESGKTLKTTLAVDEATAEVIKPQTLDTAIVEEPTNQENETSNTNPETAFDTEPVMEEEIILEDVTIEPPAQHEEPISETEQTESTEEHIDIDKFDVTPMMSSDEPLTKTPFVTDIKPVSVPDELKMIVQPQKSDTQKDAAFIEMILSGNTPSMPPTSITEERTSNETDIIVNENVPTNDDTDVTTETPVHEETIDSAPSEETPDDTDDTDDTDDLNETTNDDIVSLDETNESEDVIEQDNVKEDQPASVTISTFKDTNAETWYPTLCKIDFDTSYKAIAWAETMTKEARPLVDMLQKLTRRNGVLIEVKDNESSVMVSHRIKIEHPVDTKFYNKS